LESRSVRSPHRPLVQRFGVLAAMLTLALGDESVHACK